MNNISLLPSKKRKPKAIGDLAVLPIFFKLEGKKVILAGGSDASAWKAELLAASGATVHIYAEQLDPEFETLLHGDKKTQFVHHVRPWTTDILIALPLPLPLQMRKVMEKQKLFTALLKPLAFLLM